MFRASRQSLRSNEPDSNSLLLGWSLAQAESTKDLKYVRSIFIEPKTLNMSDIFAPLKPMGIFPSFAGQWTFQKIKWQKPPQMPISSRAPGSHHAGTGKQGILCLVLMAVKLVIAKGLTQSANYTAYKPNTTSVTGDQQPDLAKEKHL